MFLHVIEQVVLFFVVGGYYYLYNIHGSYKKVFRFFSSCNMIDSILGNLCFLIVLNEIWQHIDWDR